MTVCKMPALINLQKYQCALLKSSRKHYENAIEAVAEARNADGHLTAAAETADNAGDSELAGWLNHIKAAYETTKAIDPQNARNAAIRYNEYNAACLWGLEPLIVPGQDDGEV